MYGLPHVAGRTAVGNTRLIPYNSMGIPGCCVCTAYPDASTTPTPTMTVPRFCSGAVALTLLAMGCQPDSPPRATEASYQGEVFQEHIRTTEARTPEAERLGFKLPEGFEIQLFAAEPDIGKPLNIAFDAQGRLWVTQSHEYPFPAEPGEGVDRLSVLEDTDGDGRADRFTHYEDTLNIPIGVLPLADATLAYSIPHLYRFRDTAGDTQADRSQVLLGPFGHQDTHGMVNNLTRGYDGWVHACHGFTNTSAIAGTDGDSITMVSGNTFRFQSDGSRVEQTTFGQVNPFGLAYDEWGYLYATDCHTSPLYQLIRGADYPHFGKKETGIGFAPDTKPHGAESTALSGLAYYAATQFPEAYRHNFYIGDVVTCRIHRNSFTFQGSTPVATAEEDLLKSDDPWFRPVDIKLGPDGALYVADFYNSIIGHYEVPLDHPQRDKVRGRIWRITYRGSNQEAAPNLATASVATLIATLEHDNLTVRMTAANQLTDRVGREAARPLTELMRQSATGARSRVLALWVLHRLGSLDEAMIREAATQADPTVRTHMMRILREMDTADQMYYPLVVKALDDKNPHVRRAAVEAIANHPSTKTVEHLLAQVERIPNSDSHYQYTVRLMLRNLLQDETRLAPVAARSWGPAATETLADVLTGVDSEAAGRFLFAYLQTAEKRGGSRKWQHAARFVPAHQLADVVKLAHRQTKQATDQEPAVFQAVQEGVAQRGADPPRALAQWGTQLAERLFEQHKIALDDTAALTPKTAEDLILAATLAGQYDAPPVVPTMQAYLQQPATDPGIKVAMAKALLQIAPDENALLVRWSLERGPSAPWKRSLINALGEMDGSAMISVLAEAQVLLPDLQRAAALALAASAATRDVLFKKVRAGEIAARSLIDAKVKERLLLHISSDQLQTYEALTANVPTTDAERTGLIKARLANFSPSDTLAQSGVTVFNVHCKTCHRVSNEGGMVGPQLTGIGRWGAEALATKIIDPNRNISEAFRTYTLTMKDGQVMTGLYRRDEGEVRVFASMSGEEFSVPIDNIAEQKASQYTLMPDHFGETLDQENFNALLSYLLNMQS